MSYLHVKTKNRKFETQKNLYGIFFEDINRAGDGGLYPEMIRNRAFEDSLLPEGYVEKEDGIHVVTDSGWEDEFNRGEGLSRWIEAERIDETPVPAWYAEGARMELEQGDTLNRHRSAALRVKFEAGGCVYNTGFCGISQKKGEAYPFYMFVKVKKPMELVLSVEEGGHSFAGCSFWVTGRGYIRYDAVMVSDGDCQNARLTIRCPEGGEALFGFMSLMPGKTYNGHGLRTDLVEKLKDLRPRFMRFPGGCIVEGTTPSTVMRFRDTIGPVWERPGNLLVWHYRSCNGLGFHEYLQLCEDLDMEPMYVCNCGMTCQARKCVLLTGKALEEILQDTLDAIEYAVGACDSRWGKLRAQMGHPKPFKLTYLEIGNENRGADYEERYRRFYQEIKKRYPRIQIIANDHVEARGCMAEYVDEHFYSTAEFFAENLHYYDGYDRKGPKIFIGEQAVNEGLHRGKLYGALGEAAFLIGMEQNQDVVALSSYAPLFENIHYSCWSPNLIRFNNRESLGIPTYYVWKMFGQNRGDYVLETAQTTGKVYRPLNGMASLKSTMPLLYRNAEWNGAPTALTHEMMGHAAPEQDGFCLQPPDEAQKEALGQADTAGSFVVFGEEEQTCGKFEVDIFVEENGSFELGIFSARAILSYYDQLLEGAERVWKPFGVRPLLWKVNGDKSCFAETAFPEDRRLTEDFALAVTPGSYQRFGYETDGRVIRLLVNGEAVKEVEVPYSPSFASVATETEGEILIKMVNLDGVTDPVQITLDCSVESSYTAVVLSGKKDAENSFEQPENVRDRILRLQGASESFVYEAPAYSVSVLRLKKKICE